jgi:hypothetical protein
MSRCGDQVGRPAPKRKLRRGPWQRVARSRRPDEADRFLQWLTAQGDLQLALRKQFHI